MDFKGKLGDLKKSIDEASRVKSIADLTIGTVVYVEMDKNDGLTLTSGYTTRLKYVVVAGAKSDKKEVCAVLMNTDADYSDDPTWRADQYLLLQRDYPGILDYNSWLDCTDPKTLTVRKLKAKKAEVKGHLTDDDLKAVMSKLKNSEFISTHLKKIYGILNYDTEVE
jgi:hypothetical protein